METYGKLTVLSVEKVRTHNHSKDRHSTRYQTIATCRCVCGDIVKRDYGQLKHQKLIGATPNCNKSGCRTPFGHAKKVVVKRVVAAPVLTAAQQVQVDELLDSISRMRPVTAFDRREAVEVVLLRKVETEVSMPPTPILECKGCLIRVVGGRRYHSGAPDCPMHGVI